MSLRSHAEMVADYAEQRCTVYATFTGHMSGVRQLLQAGAISPEQTIAMMVDFDDQCKAAIRKVFETWEAEIHNRLDTMKTTDVRRI